MKKGLELCNGKTVALISSHKVSDAIYTKAKRYGIKVISVSKSQNSEMHKFSDEQFFLDSTDPNIVLPLLKEQKVDAIIAISGEKLLRKTVDWIFNSEYFHYAKAYQWDTLMNKRKFKEYASGFDIPVNPEYDFNKCSIDSVKYPVVVKPVDNSGSTGISICRSKDELVAAIKYAIDNSDLKDAICEPFLSGNFFQLEVWIQQGSGFLAYTKERLFYSQIASNPPQPFVDYYPCASNSDILNNLYHKLVKLLLSLDINNGTCMFQGIIQNNVPYIIDCAFRMSGGMDYEIVKEEKGVDLTEVHLQYALTKKFGDDFSCLRTPFRNAYASICFGLKNGKIASIEGIDKVKKMDCVFKTVQYYNENDTVTKSGNFAQTFLRVFIKADNRLSLSGLISQIIKEIRVYDEYHQSMLLPIPDYISDFNI